MNTANSYRVLLYYKFVTIDNHDQFANDHLAFCNELGLKGRILVAPEGINGTVSGTVEATQKYMDAMHADQRFSDMVFKIDEEKEHAFKKMFVRPKRSMIILHEEDELNPNEITGKHLKPKEFYEALQQEDVIVIDGRNDYEYDLGHFRNAIRPDIKSFREFPEWIKKNFREEDKKKKVISYCTGGIRCEKLTGLFMKEGFNDVNQLEGGIVTYGKDEEVKGRLWDGKCYVFDERISVPINRTEEDMIISKCTHCGKESDRYINCTNDFCNKQHFCCEECDPQHGGICSDECKIYLDEHPERNRRLREQVGSETK
ncbi:oxygen-dependent tRNA uridine(34) hydroxylase TrhO [Haloplasma contractile]|uniref:tRNA uridine(34) hydroxylase n=1 Tax=Haloplasma contractile SSD-17B TaxID=1033810 RepID=U2EB77_9MOLU|nr:rhodanese-related sulfurtransferase [Haloplasma contractile]ERJ12036.1 Rhodanese domain protein [Haloplasma contractile SSD-17B]